MKKLLAILIVVGLVVAGYKYREEIMVYTEDLGILEIFDIFDKKNKIENLDPENTSYNGIMPSDYTKTELDDVVLDYYDEFSEKYFMKVPNQDQMYLDYILDERTDSSITYVKKNAVTVSEAHGYAMLAIAFSANMDSSRESELQTDYDMFFNFFKAHPSDSNANLMCWQMVGVGLNPSDGSGSVTSVINVPTGGSGATDGDMDIAYSLLVADKVFGSNGTVDYKAEALLMINALYDTNVNHDENLLLAGDWAMGSQTEALHTMTRSSDFMVNHLVAFSNVDTEHSQEWLDVLYQTKQITIDNVDDYSGNTGLLADFIVKEDGKYQPSNGRTLEVAEDGDYNFNACRYPWRISVNSLYTDDDDLQNEIDVLNKWITKKTDDDPLKISSGYYINGGTPGTPLPDRDWTSLIFIAPMACAAATDAEYQDWLDSIFEYMVNAECSTNSYYGNSIKLMVYYTITDNYVVID